jgi:ribosomal protein L37AE/L43A
VADKNMTSCWNCGSKEMETDALGVKCKKCGATYNPVISVPDPFTHKPVPNMSQVPRKRNYK